MFTILNNKYRMLEMENKNTKSQTLFTGLIECVCICAPLPRSFPQHSLYLYIYIYVSHHITIRFSCCHLLSSPSHLASAKVHTWEFAVSQKPSWLSVGSFCCFPVFLLFFWFEQCLKRRHSMTWQTHRNDPQKADESIAPGKLHSEMLWFYCRLILFWHSCCQHMQYILPFILWWSEWCLYVGRQAGAAVDGKHAGEPM